MVMKRQQNTMNNKKQWKINHNNNIEASVALTVIDKIDKVDIRREIIEIDQRGKEIIITIMRKDH